MGVPLRGAARCRTLQVGLRWPLSTSGRSGDTMVCGSGWRQAYVVWFGFARDASAIPCGGCAWFSRAGSDRVAKGWDVSATPNGTIVLVLLATGVGALRRYHRRTECKFWVRTL